MCRSKTWLRFGRPSVFPACDLQDPGKNIMGCLLHVKSSNEVSKAYYSQSRKSVSENHLKSKMIKTLLLCFIHGFKGDEETFFQFPEVRHLHQISC